MCHHNGLNSLKLRLGPPFSKSGELWSFSWAKGCLATAIVVGNRRLRECRMMQSLCGTTPSFQFTLEFNDLQWPFLPDLWSCNVSSLLKPSILPDVVL